MISLRNQNLFDRILISPFKQGAANELLIVAGYASPRMLAEHLQAIVSLGSPQQLKLTLIVGMTGSRNLTDASVSAFSGLMFENNRLSTRVLVPDGQVDIHSKAYVWLNDGDPVQAWVGSANYSRLAFGLSDESDDRDELMAKADPGPVFEYIETTRKNCSLLNDGISRSTSRGPDEIETLEARSGFVLPANLSSKRFAVCPLVNSRTGEIHNAGAGLNWGQSSEKRSRADSSAAYIPVPARFRDFFPPVGETFEAYCPDGQVLLLARGQQGGKALATPASNELLGRYFRGALKITHPEKITTEDLLNYGSDCVVFEKTNGGAFYLHFYPGLMREQLLDRVE